jgi:LacI family transcriptional regulator
LRLGRRNIGLIAGPLEWLEARQRKQGWEDALKNFGVAISDRQWAQGNYSSANGESTFAELIQKYPELDAVLASNDQMALGVLHYAHAHRLAIPEDLAVIGFDDLTEAAYFSPSLTTVTHLLRELGILAVITAQIEGADGRFPGKSYTLQTELLVRYHAKSKPLNNTKMPSQNVGGIFHSDTRWSAYVKIASSVGQLPSKLTLENMAPIVKLRHRTIPRARALGGNPHR